MAPKKKKVAPRKVIRHVHFETTIPVIRQCRKCGVWLAAGVAEGSKAEIEFVPLDTGQQIWAIVNRIQLYCLWRSGLVRLDASRLRGRLRGAVYPQHHCHVKWPTPPPKPLPKKDPNEPPPF